MSVKLRLFFLGSLGVVVLAVSWLVFRGYHAGQANPSNENATPLKTPSRARSEKLLAAKPTPEAKIENDQASTSASPHQQETTSKNKFADIKGDWITPNQITYLDESPQQKKVLEVLKLVGELKFPAVDEPYYVGMNDQSLDQYEYNSRDGARVVQWKRSNDLAVEEINLDNGDKIIRRAPENDRPFTEVSYENKAAGTYQSVYYRTNGTVESIRMEQGKTTNIYYYDEQGRLTDVYTYTEK